MLVAANGKDQKFVGNLFKNTVQSRRVLLEIGFNFVFVDDLLILGTINTNY